MGGARGKAYAIDGGIWNAHIKRKAKRRLKQLDQEVAAYPNGGEELVVEGDSGEGEDDGGVGGGLWWSRWLWCGRWWRRVGESGVVDLVVRETGNVLEVLQKRSPKKFFGGDGGGGWLVAGHRFPAQSVRSSNAYALDSPYLLVLNIETSQSRQHDMSESDSYYLSD
nr:hypothetical protein [Tanacetum cinerariifolium]